MAIRNDLTGQKFGRLTVLGLDLDNKSKNRRWICQCDCGTIKSIQGCNIKSGLTQSCGCLHKEKISKNLVGQKFGKLTVIKDSEKRTKDRGIIWECQCECGNITYVSTNNLIQKYTFSCGCLKQSHGEFIIEKLLQENNISYKKEYVFTDLKSPKGQFLRFDFAILNENNEVVKLIEFDGETHHLQSEGGWNTREKIEYQQKLDEIKNQYCEINNIKLLRIPFEKRYNLTIGDLI